MMSVYIQGAYQTLFGQFGAASRNSEKRTLRDLMIESGRGAIADANIDAEKIDAIWVGACAPGSFNSQDHLAPIALDIADEALLHKPFTHVSGACASSSLALYDAIYALESGRYKTVLVMGVELMTDQSTADIGNILAKNSYWPEEGAMGTSFADLFAMSAQAYKRQYRLASDTFERMLAHVSARAYRNGSFNPLAHCGPTGFAVKKNLLSAEAILQLIDIEGANPLISDPLRLHDCSLISDGAAAIVLTNDASSIRADRPRVRISGVGHAVDHLAMKKRAGRWHTLVAGRIAIERAMAEAKVSVKDIQIAEVHDCFTIAQLMCIEAMGLCDPGQAGFAIEEGGFDESDKCSINLSGGLKAKGHPVGATGAAMHGAIYKHLIGEPIGLSKREQPTVGMVFNMGGAGVTNCATVLQVEN